MGDNDIDTIRSVFPGKVVITGAGKEYLICFHDGCISISKTGGGWCGQIFVNGSKIPSSYLKMTTLAGCCNELLQHINGDSIQPCGQRAEEAAQYDSNYELKEQHLLNLSELSAGERKMKLAIEVIRSGAFNQPDTTLSGTAYGMAIAQSVNVICEELDL